ncbi:hypothetical protein [uncultured Roseobacter sp.]|uniref:hypothetical protein n=1 Tax=uncultured Roseobacter sp. TaxID=114847 RepID=UPI0026288B1B|nr:hypothetical protein [uncultured Roseobacter sp.]
MTPEQDYHAILAHLSRHEPLALDRLVFDAATPAPDAEVHLARFPPSAAIWDTPADRQSRIGIRITAPVENADFLAGRLASIAVERQILPVFLSYIGTCGMQRFGFRVEQLSGVPKEAQDHFEAQLTRFWRLAMIVDASEIDRLG